MLKLFIFVLIIISSCTRYEYDIINGKKVKYYYTNRRFSTTNQSTGSCKGDGFILLFCDSMGKVTQIRRDSLIKWFKFFR